MPHESWSIEQLIENQDIPYEESLSKDPDNFSSWLYYYKVKSSQPSCTFQNKVFILERAMRQFPRSYKMWIMYIELSLGELESVDLTRDKDSPIYVDKLFRRALKMLHKAPVLWERYFSFLVGKNIKGASEIKNTFTESLMCLPVTQHYLIWPHYITFADLVGGQIGADVYCKYLQFASEESLAGIDVNKENGVENLTIDKVIRRLLELDCFNEASQLFQKVVIHPEAFLGLPIPQLTVWKDFIDGAIEHIGEQKQELTLKSMDNFLEFVVSEGTKRFQDQIGYFVTSIGKYFCHRGQRHKARYFYDKGLKECFTVQDFTSIYNTMAEFEESWLDDLKSELELQVEEADLKVEFEIRMSLFEDLMDQRPFLLNSTLLRQDVNNLDEWFNRIKLFRGESNIAQVLTTYASALVKVNPLKAHSISGKPENTLVNLWITYSDIYASQKDIRTADLIFSKAVKSQFQSPDDLASLYIAWSQLFVKQGNTKKAIEIVEQVCMRDPREIDYFDANISIFERVCKSIKLWSYYLDLLESIIDSSAQTNEIEKVSQAYEKVMKFKLASPLMLVNYADFMESWHGENEALAIYAKGLKYFKDSKVRFEIWNIYLSKLVETSADIESIRESFESCLYGNFLDGGDECPPDLCKPVLLLYSEFEFDQGYLTKSITVLQNGLKKVTAAILERLNETKNQLRSDKFDLYLALINRVNKLNNPAESREIYETSLRDDQLLLSSIVQLTSLFIDFELMHKELNRTRALFKYICSLCRTADPILKPLWAKWEDVELHFGNEYTTKDFLQFKKDRIERDKQELTKQNTENGVGFVKPAENIPTETNATLDSTTSNPEAIELDMN